MRSLKRKEEGLLMALYESKLLDGDLGVFSFDLEYRDEKFGGYNTPYGEVLWVAHHSSYNPDYIADPDTGIYYYVWPGSNAFLRAEPIGEETIDLISLRHPLSIPNKIIDARGLPYVVYDPLYERVSLYDYYVIICKDNSTDENLLFPIVSSRAFSNTTGPIIGSAKGSNNYAREINAVGGDWDATYGLLFQPIHNSPYDGSDPLKGTLIPLNKHNLWINFPAINARLYELINGNYIPTADPTCVAGKTYYKDSSGAVSVTEDSLFNGLQTGSDQTFYDYMSSVSWNHGVGIVYKEDHGGVLHSLSQYETDPTGWYVLENLHKYITYVTQLRFSTAYKLNGSGSSTSYCIPVAVLGVFGKGFSLRDS